MIYILKCWPEPFQAIVDGRKTHEVRRFADRDFREGERVLLREYDPSTDKGYTGRGVSARIGFVTKPGDWGLPAEIGCFSLRDVVLLTTAETAEQGQARANDPWTVRKMLIGQLKKLGF